MDSPNSKQETKAVVDSAELNNNSDKSETDKGEELPSNNNTSSVMGKITCAGCVSGNCEGCPLTLRMIQNLDTLSNKKKNNSEYDSIFGDSGGDMALDSFEKSSAPDIVGDATDTAKENDEMNQNIETDSSEPHSYMDQLLDDDIELVVADIFTKSNDILQQNVPKLSEPPKEKVIVKDVKPENEVKPYKKSPKKIKKPKSIINQPPTVNDINIEKIVTNDEIKFYDKSSSMKIEEDDEPDVNEKYVADDNDSTDRTVNSSESLLVVAPEAETTRKTNNIKADDKIIDQQPDSIVIETIEKTIHIQPEKILQIDEIITIPKNNREIVVGPDLSDEIVTDLLNKEFEDIDSESKILIDSEVESELELDVKEPEQEFLGYLYIPKKEVITEAYIDPGDSDEKDQTTSKVVKTNYTNNYSLDYKDNIFILKRLVNYVFDILPVMVI